MTFGLCRYITRPAIANERLKRDGAGDVVLQLKSAWRDGTTHIKMSPLEFMQAGRVGNWLPTQLTWNAGATAAGHAGILAAWATSCPPYGTNQLS